MVVNDPTDPAAGAGHAEPRAVLGRRLGLRAQARRAALLAVRTARGTKLYSRSARRDRRRSRDRRGPGAQASTDFVIDGEVVAFEGSRTSFERLQPRIHVSSADKARRSGVPVYFYVFDVLRADGEDVARRAAARPQAEAAGAAHLRGPDPLHAAPAQGRRGLLRRGLPQGLGGADRQACGRGVRDRPHRPLAEVQVRGRPGARRRRLDRPGGLAGGARRTAAGLPRRRRPACTPARSAPASRSRSCATSTRRLSRARGRRRRPCTAGSLPRKAVHWARPRLVAEVAFTEWTPRRPAPAPALPRAAHRQEGSGRGEGAVTDRRGRRRRDQQAGQGAVPGRRA